MMQKVKLPAIYIEQDFFTKPRNIKFLERHGCRGLLVIQAVWCLLANETRWFLDGSMMKPSICAPFLPAHEAFEAGEWERFLDDALMSGLLEMEKRDGIECYYNSKITSHAKKYIERAGSYKKAWEERRAKNGSMMKPDETIMKPDGFSMDCIKGRPLNLDTALRADKTPQRSGTVPFGDYQKVYLTTLEFNELVSNFGKVAVEAKITHLDAQIENGVKKYKSYKNHAACIRNWCTSDRASGRVPKEEPLPKGFTYVSRDQVRGPDGKVYGLNFVRNMQEGQTL